MSRRARILRLFGLYTVLDIALVARALSLSQRDVSSTFSSLAQTKDVKRFYARTCRRKTVRAMYALEAHA